MATPIIDTRAGNEVPLKALKGETWQVEFDVIDAAQQPIDLTSADVTIVCKKQAKDDDATAPFKLTRLDGLTITGSGNHKIRTSKVMTLDKDGVYKVIVVLNGQPFNPYFGALTIDIR